MKPEGALFRLRFHMKNHDTDKMSDSLKQAQEMAMAALKKQEPALPYIQSDGDCPEGNPVWDYSCPECSYNFDDNFYDYCPKCGQAIDWRFKR